MTSISIELVPVPAFTSAENTFGSSALRAGCALTSKAVTNSTARPSATSTPTDAPQAEYRPLVDRGDDAVGCAERRGLTAAHDPAAERGDADKYRDDGDLDEQDVAERRVEVATRREADLPPRREDAR